MTFVNCGWCNRKLGFPKEDWKWEYWKHLPICNIHWCEKEFNDRINVIEMNPFKNYNYCPRCGVKLPIPKKELEK